MNKLLTERGIIQYPLSESNKKTVLNYDTIKSALNIEGLSNNLNPSSVDANTKFINEIRQLECSQRKCDNDRIAEKIPPKVVKSAEEEQEKTAEPQHDVRNYTKLYHPVKNEPDEKKPLRDRLRILSALCLKQPYERSSEEVANIHRILRTISKLSCQMEDDMLKLLSEIIQYERIEYADITVFANKAFYIILKGSVKPLSSPWIRLVGEPEDKFINQQQNSLLPSLFPGDCFGTLNEIMNEEFDCSKFLMSKTAGYCELAYITTSYYRRVLEKYSTQKHSDKLTLMKKQEAFGVWPQQALVKVANILQWAKIPSNTLICKEETISPVLSFIQSGECYVLRKLVVKKALPGGKTVNKTKQVIIGEIGSGKTFGEISFLDNTPMEHSIFSKNDLVVVQIDRQRLSTLDKDVKQLLRQSCTAEFANVSKVDVERIYLEQTTKSEWANFKESIISEVIDCKGIRPGLGKWSTISDPTNLL